MSKLSLAIDYKATGNITALNKLNYNYTDISINSHTKQDFMREYEILVKIYAKKWFDEDSLIISKENENAIKQDVYTSIKKAIVEEIFGEFRPIIYEMQSAIYDRDTTRLRLLTSELEHKMFYEGI
jgi:hypothetical protein